MDTVKLDCKNVKMVAHRGLSGIERENTYPAFVAAANRSYYGIESDVHKTADGKFVIIHDETTKRVSLGAVNINVEESNFSDIENILLPDKDESTSRRDIRIPLLADYISICKKYQKICVLELKNDFAKEDIVKMLDEIRSVGYLDGVTFISFSLENCLILRDLLPDSNIQWLISGNVTDDIIKTLTDNALDLDVSYKSLTRELVERLHALGIEVNCWTCDDKEDGKALVDMGVDYITTNILE